MELEHLVENNICTVSIQGKLVHHTVSKVKVYSQSLLKYDMLKGVVLHLGKVSFIDSTGIGIIIFLFREFEKQRVQLVVCEAEASIFQILQMAGLDRMIPFYSTEEAALNSFNDV
ncbi:MAG: anti-sigma factor antagonist [SAR324 cluster bacterium]|nr:anti-sigma factor antagonist [SAR324 cluster bacterium]